ncbi:MAG: ABC transporter substrate-binding protein, partial [Candidatus Bathyarchaeia archaeon]
MFVSASFVAIEAVAAENGVFVLNQSSNPYELIEGVTWFPETLDPAKCYDVASAELILNVYETLISFNGERSDLFIPLLAEEWGFSPPFPSSPSYTNYTVWFRIRAGVPFHTWSRSMTWGQYYLTTEDVEYSFERLLVHDYQGGPQLALYEPLLGVGGALGLEATGFTIPEIGQLIDSAVQRNDLYVWFNIVDGNYQSITFLRMLAQPWCAVISKQWVNEFVNPWGYAAGIDMNEIAPGLQFEWDGFWGDYTGWADYWGWDESSLDLVDWTGVTCGTGPYILDYYDPLYGWSVVRYYDYWQGWPALGPSPPYPPYPSSGIRPSGYIERFTVQRLWDWQTIILNLLVGYIDLAPIPVEYAGQLHVNGNINGPTVEGIRLVSMLFPYAPYVIRCYMRTWVNGWFYSPLYTVP